VFDLKQSTAITIPFFAHDGNGDGVPAIADGSWTKRISKNGGAWAAMTVTITEGENGWYFLPIGTGHSDTLGFLAVSLSAAACKRVNLMWRVSANLIDDVAAYVDTEVAAIKAKTDQLTFTAANKVDATIQAAADLAQAAADKVWSTTTRALTDKAGFSLTSAEEDTIVDKVWDEAIAGHLTAGTTGAKLNGLSSDPWTSALPGIYTEGSAGQILGNIGRGLVRIEGYIIRPQLPPWAPGYGP
jgi:hypothetical protein